jgi:hypothetical protein
MARPASQNVDYSIIDTVADPIPPSVAAPVAAPVATPIAAAASAPGVESSPAAVDFLSQLSGREKVFAQMLPPEFKTREWIILVIALHDPEANVDALAESITGHLEHCLEFGTLPSQLNDLPEDPASALARVLGPLPIAQQRPDMIKSLMQLIIKQLSDDGWLAKANPIAEPVTSDEEAAA